MIKDLNLNLRGKIGRRERKITIIDKSMFSTSWKKTGGIFVVRANNDTANFITWINISRKRNCFISALFSFSSQTPFPNYSRQRKFFTQNSKLFWHFQACNWHNNLFWKFVILRLNFVFFLLFLLRNNKYK